MIKRLLTPFLLFFTLLASAQIDFENAPWDLDCYDYESTYEMNKCGAKANHIIDSVITAEYSILSNHIDEKYLNYKAMIDRDSTDQSLVDYTNGILEQKVALKEMNNNFLAYKKSAVAIVANEYEGGSIQGSMTQGLSLQLKENYLRVILALKAEMISTR